MHTENNNLQWLHSRSNVILSELMEISEMSNNPETGMAFGKIVELMEINQQIQSLFAVQLLTTLKSSEMEIDDQLNEIAGYLESVLDSRQREAENLRKIQ